MNKIALLPIFLFGYLQAFAQVDDYRYKRELEVEKPGIYTISLTEDIYGKLNERFSDLRLYGIQDNDTIEAPYILRKNEEREEIIYSDFDLINESRNNEGYYYTFELPNKDVPINRIELKFNYAGYDWLVKLEGSQDGKEWYTLTDDYRIVSIKNRLANFTFSTLVFPVSKFNYYRLTLPPIENPGLVGAKFSERKLTEGKTKEIEIETEKIVVDEEAKTTVIDLELGHWAPVSAVNLDFADEFDFYRPIRIERVRDSFKLTDKWQYNYDVVASGTVSSLGENRFKFPSVLSNRLKITIENEDNQALEVNNATVIGNQYELVARFTEEARYYLVYGNKNAAGPKYDLGRFIKDTSEKFEQLSLGEPVETVEAKPSKGDSLFENKIWLWLIIGAAVLLLGWFALTLMKKQHDNS